MPGVALYLLLSYMASLFYIYSLMGPCNVVDVDGDIAKFKLKVLYSY